MKHSRLLKLLIVLLLQVPISSVSLGKNHNRGWVHVEIGKDNKNKYYAILENNLIRCKYGWRHHKEPKNGQSYIRELMLKSINYNMGDWIDAAAGKRGPLTNVTLVCDRNDKKTIRLEWNDGDKIQEVTIYPNSLILKIDYIKILGFPHIVDVGSHGGRKIDNATFIMYGAEEWQELRKTNKDARLINHQNEHHRLTYDLYPTYPFPIIDTPDWKGFAPVPLNYDGNLIVGVYNSENGIGYGRVMPFNVINYFKLLDDGFEFFPFWKIPPEKRTFPFTGYLFLVDGGGNEEIIGTGKGIVDNLSINDGTSGRGRPGEKN